MEPSTSWSTTEFVRPPSRVSPPAPSTAVILAFLSSTWPLTTSQMLPLATLPIIVSLISREKLRLPMDHLIQTNWLSTLVARTWVGANNRYVETSTSVDTGKGV